MALRALLFSSDGSSTPTLCKVLTDLGIEAEICPELLVAAERVSRENYDAILVDWDRESEAIVLLKTAREQKRNTYQALNLALVQNDKDLPRALQHGANSAIRKPIDPQQAHDTLSTARDLILSRQAEQKQKEARAAAFQAEAAAVAAEFPDGDEPPPQKTGFLSQTAPRSAFEVEEQTEKHELGKSDHHAQATVMRAGHYTEAKTEAPKPRSPEKKRWDEKPAPSTPAVEERLQELPRSQDTTHVFSSLPEEEEAPAETEPSRKTRSQYLGFALVGCLLVIGVLWVWAPGDSYRSRVSSIRQSLSALSSRKGEPQSTPTPAGPAEQVVQTTPAKVDQPAGETDPVDTTEVDPSKIQIIETKSIPKPGAQQPPTNDPPPDSDQAKQAAEPETQAAAASEPTQPTPQPQVIPISRPQPSPAPAPTSARANPPSASEGRVGVIIPDSLRNTPSAAPASSLEAPIVPEETSRDLVLHRVEPEYPAQALGQRLTGQVVLQVWVARDGSILDVKLVKGYFALARAASDAVKQWRFRPFSPNGTPISFQTYVTLNFKYPG